MHHLVTSMIQTPPLTWRSRTRRLLLLLLLSRSHGTGRGAGGCCWRRRRRRSSIQAGSHSSTLEEVQGEEGEIRVAAWQKLCILNQVGVMRFPWCSRTTHDEVGSVAVATSLNSFREVDLSLGAFKAESRSVVCHGCLLGRLEGPEPNPGRFVRVPNLSCPFPPRPSPHSPVMSPDAAALWLQISSKQPPTQ